MVNTIKRNLIHSAQMSDHAQEQTRIKEQKKKTSSTQESDTLKTNGQSPLAINTYTDIHVYIYDWSSKGVYLYIT